MQINLAMDASYLPMFVMGCREGQLKHVVDT